MKNGLYKTTPQNVGMDEKKLDDAFSLLTREVDESRIPGAVAIVGRNGKIAGTCSVGDSINTSFAHNQTDMDTIYDCASLTKVVVTMPLILSLVEKGLIYLNDPVSKYIPAFQNGKKAHITIKHLLTHTSGLKPFISKELTDMNVDEIKDYIYSRDLDYDPGARVVYSDLGFIILGEVISIVLNQTLDQAAKEFIFEPLGMTDSQFCPLDSLKKRIAATEYREDFGHYLWGEVHDERAYALGGVSGHAGLFSTAGDLARYAAMWLNKGTLLDTTILSPEVVDKALKNYTNMLDGNRGLGWVLKGDSFDASGDLFSSSAYGHTGFTGTSIWIDPTNDLFVVLLTNRVHFGREMPITQLRKNFHTAVAASIINV